MTGDEIKTSGPNRAAPSFDGLDAWHWSLCEWVQEIAYQLAKLNESNVERVKLLRDMGEREIADRLADDEPGDTLAHTESAKKDAEATPADKIAAVLRSCAQTVQEQCVDGFQSADYLRAYAEAVERAPAETCESPFAIFAARDLMIKTDREQSAPKSAGAADTSTAPASSPSPKCLNCAGYADAELGQSPVVTCRACGRKTREPEGWGPSGLAESPTVAESGSTTQEESGYPKILPYGAGRFGLWLHPGAHPWRTFYSEEAAQLMIQRLAAKVDEGPL